MRGKAPAADHDSYAARDHPRLCGEKNFASGTTGGVAGSPPPMRGKATNFLVFGCAFGITPAYAGKSAASSSDCRLYWDHPRLCGEKLPVCVVIVNVSGSPPPMRGKGGVVCTVCFYRRITPAYAGKSLPAPSQ